MTTEFKFKKIGKYMDNKKFSILDIGCGNNSAIRTKKRFPECKYYGLDLSKNYNNDSSNFELMENFYELDLTTLNYTTIPDNSFDVINMSHVIEHLYNGDKVVKLLIPKLKKNGIIYIEFPSFRSTKLPSMKGSLNFFDDSTHIRIFTLKELYNLLLINNFTIIEGSVRRDLINIFLIPYRILKCLIRWEKPSGYIFWDLLGFADYVIAKRND